MLDLISKKLIYLSEFWINTWLFLGLSSDSGFTTWLWVVYLEHGWDFN